MHEFIGKKASPVICFPVEPDAIQKNILGFGACVLYSSLLKQQDWTMYDPFKVGITCS